MVQYKLAFLFLTSILLQVQSCNLKVSAFRAYQDNFVVFDISYEGNPRSIGIKLSVDQPVLNIENINGIDYLKSNISRHDINLQPYHLRVGDKIYYKLFLETQDGRGNCETVIDEIQIQAMTDDPRFSEPIPNVTVALGRDASLPCVVENLGTYKVAWIHIDRQMILTIHRHVISRVPRFSVSHDNAKTWLLHVSSVQQEDRGYYMCQVNTNPMISQVGYLQVVVPPNILDTESTQSTVAVRENQNISLTCKADGFPTPKIMWRREDGQAISVERRKKVNVYDGEQLNLTRISRTEMGAYLCIATNGVPPSVSKRIIVDVEFSPMIWVPNQLVGAPAGTDVTIDCHTEAYPRAISYWVYDNVMLLPTKKYGTDTAENSYRAHMKLTVRNLQPGDFGNYRCISKNSLGETEGSIRLYEIPMPSTPPRATEMKSSSNKERCVCISRWAAPQLAVVTLHFILSGPIIHN